MDSTKGSLKGSFESVKRNPHTEILRRLTGQSSAEMAQSSAEMAKMRTNSQIIAQNLFLCLFVSKLSTDRTADDIGAHFISLFHKHPKYNLASDPIGLAWLAVSPKGRKYFMFYWRKQDANALPLFEEFCRKTKRSFGILNPDLTCNTGADQFSFFACNFIYQDDFIRNISHLTKKIPLNQIVSIGKKLLSQKKDRIELIEEWTFLSDTEAHDNQLQDRIRSSFAKKTMTCAKRLVKNFGEPTQTGKTENKDFPCNGVFQFAIWRFEKRVLYLGAIQEDCELPIQLVIGTLKP